MDGWIGKGRPLGSGRGRDLQEGARSAVPSGDGGDLTDAEAIGYTFLTPEHIADAIVHTIDQPWGVSLSDVTVRASGDYYIA